MAMSNSNLACDTVIRLETFAELFSLQGDGGGGLSGGQPWGIDTVRANMDNDSDEAP